MFNELPIAVQCKQIQKIVDKFCKKAIKWTGSDFNETNCTLLLTIKAKAK